MYKQLTVLSTLLFSLPAFSAIPVDLSAQSDSFLVQHVQALGLKEKSRTTDFNNTLHVRIFQTWQGYPVWGGDGVLHAPGQGHVAFDWRNTANANIFMNGILHLNIENDLKDTPSSIFSSAQSQAALGHVLSLYKNTQVKDSAIQMLVYMDANHKAHWAFKINLTIPGNNNRLPKKPVYLVDAKDFTVYQQWDEVKTLEDVKAGGFAGNHKVGKKVIDGLGANPKPFDIQRDSMKQICYMQNNNLMLKDYRTSKTMNFNCNQVDAQHNNIYWNANHDQIETTWSPSNDVMYGLEITRNLFKDWYNLPMLVKNGKPMFLNVVVHDPIENAYWDGSKALFGDSRNSKYFNPFTQLDTVAHEISHGFTEQHSDLVYSGQSGGLNEAFSDIVGIAAEYYAYGETQFLVGLGDVKAEGKALRYMDQPSKDCEGREPGNWCSIDHMSQYDDYIDVHFSSGIFNRAYYNLANTQGWDARKALNVMVKANVDYWTSTTSFAKAACGVMQAAKDYKYDLKSVIAAFNVVGIETKTCKLK